MKNITIHRSNLNKSSAIQITGSKSESNRLLLLKALYPGISLENISNSDDSTFMQKALSSSEDSIDIHHAGTAMRFLTAYFSTQEGREVVLTGSQRMKERPIKILVEALRHLGADITYEGQEDFPPLRIKGKVISGYKVTLAANVSSQYISALLLIGTALPNGIELTLEGKITSVPYIRMTLSLLEQLGVSTDFTGNIITVEPFREKEICTEFTVESDWSSASYYYSIVALSDIGTQIELSYYKAKSLQGDSVLEVLYKVFGVTTTYTDNGILLEKQSDVKDSTNVRFDLSDAPDIAQTIAVTAFALGLECHLTGLHTLKIKETDRLMALQTELQKLGAFIDVTDKSLHLEKSHTANENVSIATYNDHRMAMAFAPLALRVPIIIEDANVVSKSYPQYWSDLQSIGFNLNN